MTLAKNAMEERKMVKLKKCPFCGGEPEIRHGGLAFMASVACRNCGAEVRSIDESPSLVELQAIEKWNRRENGNESD